MGGIMKPWRQNPALQRALYLAFQNLGSGANGSWKKRKGRKA